jgi:hypothetical protein
MRGVGNEIEGFKDFWKRIFCQVLQKIFNCREKLLEKHEIRDIF